MATLCNDADLYRVTGLDVTALGAGNAAEFIAEAESEIINMCTQWWGSIRETTEYFYRRENLHRRLPPRKHGFISSDPSDDDLNETDYVTLRYRPFVRFDRVFLLERAPTSLSAVFNYDLGTVTFTDDTVEANSVGGTAFSAFDAAPATGDMVYVGCNNQFEGVEFLMARLGVDAGATTVAYEYWNGVAWAVIPGAVDGSTMLTAEGRLTFKAPRDWAQTLVNGVTAFYVRLNLTNYNYTTDPTIMQIFLTDVIDTEYNVRDIDVGSTGRANFLDKSFKAGVRDLKIRYFYGTSSVPNVVRDLCANLAGLRALTRMIGGSYDDVTSYSIPDFTASKGEPYTNLRAAIIEMEKRLFGWKGGERGRAYKGLLSSVGADVDVAITGIDDIGGGYGLV